MGTPDYVWSSPGQNEGEYMGAFIEILVIYCVADLIFKSIECESGYSKFFLFGGAVLIIIDYFRILNLFSI